MKKNGYTQAEDACASPEFFIKASLGLIPGVKTVSKFGQSHELEAGSFVDIWDGGGSYDYPADVTTPISHLISDSSSDTELVEIQGLAGDGTLVVQTLTLTGTAKVALSTPLWRVFRLKNVGTIDLVGTVSLIDTSDTDTYAMMQPGNNQTLMALYTVPKGYTAVMVSFDASLSGVAKGFTAGGKLMMRPYGGVFQLKKTFGLDDDGDSSLGRNFNLAGKISELTDIRIACNTNSSGGIANSSFELLLFENSTWGL